MELNEFLEKFLPEIKKKYFLWFNPHFRSHYKDEEIDMDFQDCEDIAFIENYFPEALQNFADRICEKQRENCVNIASPLKYNGIMGVNYDSIRNAKQPKIEEI